MLATSIDSVFDLVGIAIGVAPLAILVAYVMIAMSRKGAPANRSWLIPLVIGTVGAGIGVAVAHQIYWSTHGPDNEFLYYVPGALIGGGTFIGTYRGVRWLLMRWLKSDAVRQRGTA
jgi:hypothetical protein